MADVITLPEKRKKTLRVEVMISKMKFEKVWREQHVRALISIPLDAPIIPEPGQLMVVAGFPERPMAPLNPEEFDYQKYLWNKGIVWTDYLQDGSYRVVGGINRVRTLTEWSMLVSQWADKIFRQHIQDDQSYGLVKAMLLGRRDDLGIDQVDNYTTSGTVHILSVSGMHVAIIFMALSKLLGWLKRLKGGKFVYLLVLTSLLLFYALVTGLPPSVQRATFMCIVLIIAETIGRKDVSLNTLAISALIILAIDPHALFDLGFQLSFMAMAGIFLLYEPMEMLWKPSNRILQFIWQISALSFAAQLATFPLSLYYFHQFPFYFWLVNPFVIFFTNILLPAAMVLLLVSTTPFTWLQLVADQLVHWSAYLTNKAVGIPKMLPGYLINNLYLDKAEVVLLYLFIFGFWFAYYNRRLMVIRYTSFVGLVFIFYSLSQSIQRYYTSTAVIHSVPRHAVVSFKEGEKLYVMSDSQFVSDTDAYHFRLKNYAISQGVLETIYVTEKSYLMGNEFVIRRLTHGNLASWRGRLISQRLPPSVHANYSIISDRYPPKVALSNRNTVFMLGGEVRGKRSKAWEKYFTENKYVFYDLSQKALLLQ